MKKITKIVVYYDDGTYEETYSQSKPGAIPCSPWPSAPGAPYPYPMTAPYVKQNDPSDMTPMWHANGCRVCGLGKNGESLGYVCPRFDCPTKVTC